MRGAKFLDINHHVIDAVLMSKYKQAYSAIDDIPTETVIFLLRFLEAQGDYQEAEMKKLQAKKGKR
jgi:hypothetical protein